MPAFDHGKITIIVCPDATDEPPPVPMAMHHKGHLKHHDQCPYASASSLGALGADFSIFLDTLILVAALLLGRTFQFVDRHSRQLRPPLRGPPLSA